MALFHRLLQVIARDSAPADRSERDDNRNAMLSTIPEKMMERFRSQIPVGRIGAPEEIAHVAAFLADDESSYVTGQIWAVNGGLDI